MRTLVRRISALGVLVTAVSCVAPRDPSSTSSAGLCVVKSTEFAVDLAFTVECSMKGEEWGWCSKGCPAELGVAYDAKTSGGSGQQGTMVTPGLCETPIGSTIVCRFPSTSTGEAFGKEKARLEQSSSPRTSGLGVENSSVHLRWTDFEGKRRVDIEMQDPVFGRRRTSRVRLDPATAEKTAAAVDQTIASWSNQQVAAREQAQAAKVAEAEKEKEWLRTTTDACNAGKADACFDAAKWMAAHDSGSMLGPSVMASQALSLMRKSCELGYQPGCDAAQNAHLEPTQRSQHNTMDEDAASLRDRCKRGDNAACVVFQSVSKCQQGLSEGCDSAGNAYLGALGGTRDVSKATAYWRRACEISAPRCVGYGVQLLRAGEQAAAFRMFDTGCEGDADQCAMIGTILRQGPNAAKARNYLEKGCNSGSAKSCQILRSP